MVFRLDPDAPRPDGAAHKRGGGPTSAFGRQKARANSLQHGFRAKTVLSEDMASAVADQARILDKQFLPVTDYEYLIINEMALARVKLDQAAALLIANCDRAVGRARDFWDYDQTQRALRIERRLPKNPRLAYKLAGTKQGALLMIQSWEGLAAAAVAAGDWDDPQRQTALDLLGIPLALRSSGTVLALGPAGDKEALAALAGREIARLRDRIENVLDAQDARDQADTIAGRRLADDDETRLLRRYQAAAQRDHNRAHAELLRVQEQRFEDEYDDACAAGLFTGCDGNPRGETNPGHEAEGAGGDESTATAEPPAASGPSPRPAAQETIVIGQAKSTPHAECTRELRKSADRVASRQGGAGSP
jgi:hypothetical protein